MAIRLCFWVKTPKCSRVGSGGGDVPAALGAARDVGMASLGGQRSAPGQHVWQQHLGGQDVLKKCRRGHHVCLQGASVVRGM